MRSSSILTELYVANHVKSTTSASAMMRDEREAIVTEGNLLVINLGMIVMSRMTYIYGIVRMILPRVLN